MRSWPGGSLLAAVFVVVVLRVAWDSTQPEQGARRSLPSALAVRWLWWRVRLHSRLSFAHVLALPAVADEDVVGIVLQHRLSLCGDVCVLLGVSCAGHSSNNPCSVVQHMRWNVSTPAAGVSCPLSLDVVWSCGVFDAAAAGRLQCCLSGMPFANNTHIWPALVSACKCTTCWCRGGVYLSCCFAGPSCSARALLGWYQRSQGRFACVDTGSVPRQ